MNSILAVTTPLKDNEKRVYRYEVEGSHYGILILERGERLFFQENDRAFLCDISARDSVLNEKSIKKWDDGEKISDSDKKRLIPVICSLYEKSYKDKLQTLSN